MRKIILFVLIAVFVSFTVRAADNLHVVKTGDTLWALSKTHYKNPFLWGKIWVNNTYLNDPNLIFPGEVIQYTKHGIAIYKKTVKKKPEKSRLEKYDSVVFYDSYKYYSDCGGGFCRWHKKDFPAGKLSYDNYNNIEVTSGSIVYVHTNKNIDAAHHLYVYREMKDYYSLSLSPHDPMSVFVPIGEIKLEKKVKKDIYKGVIVRASEAVSANDIVSAVYPYKFLDKAKKAVILGNIPIKLIIMHDSCLTPHIGYYMSLKIPEPYWQLKKRETGHGYHITKLPKPFTKNIVGKEVFLDRVNKSLPENTNIGRGIVISQYKNYISVFFDSYNSSLKEIFDKTQNYVLR